jgi:hypothetical protein
MPIARPYHLRFAEPASPRWSRAQEPVETTATPAISNRL